MDSSPSARFRAVQQLQRARDRHPIASRRFDEFDHAIDLVLSPARTLNPYLVRNGIRDAERILRRRRRRARLQFYSELNKATEDHPSGDPADSLIDAESPEAQILAHDLARGAVCRVPYPRARVEKVLGYLIEGYTTREIATAMGVSQSQISLVVSEIKAALIRTAASV